MSSPTPATDTTNRGAVVPEAEEVSTTVRRPAVTRADEVGAPLVPVSKRRKGRDVVAETAGTVPARQPAPTAEQLREIATNAIAKEAMERMGE